MKTYLRIYRSGNEYKTVEYNDPDELKKLINEDEIETCKTLHIGNIIWNTGEETFDLTDEDVEKLVKSEIEYDKLHREISKYCNRWRWLYIIFALVFRFPFMLLQCAFEIFKNIFELCANGIEWVHEGIDKIGNRIFDYPMRNTLDAYFKVRCSDDRDLYLVQKKRHEAIQHEFQKNDNN